jgi:hypothetical protein
MVIMPDVRLLCLSLATSMDAASGHSKVFAHNNLSGGNFLPELRDAIGVVSRSPLPNMTLLLIRHSLDSLTSPVGTDGLAYASGPVTRAETQLGGTKVY